MTADVSQTQTESRHSSLNELNSTIYCSALRLFGRSLASRLTSMLTSNRHLTVTRPHTFGAASAGLWGSAVCSSTPHTPKVQCTRMPYRTSMSRVSAPSRPLPVGRVLLQEGRGTGRLEPGGRHNYSVLFRKKLANSKASETDTSAEWTKKGSHRVHTSTMVECRRSVRM